MKTLLGAIISILFCVSVFSQTGTNRVSLEWCPSLDTNVVGYTLYYGAGYKPEWRESIYDTNNPCAQPIIQGTNFFRTYTHSIILSNTTTCVLTNLNWGLTYYFSVTARDEWGLESDFSDETQYTVTNKPPVINTNLPPAKPENFRILVVK